jgi:catechol 2,3-dioxygenase-like lactoylglutathione lyase family enzyme
MSETTKQAIGVARFDTVVLDCPDPRGLAAFYGKILGWVVVDDDDDWVTLRDTSDPAAGKVGIAFQLATDFVAPTWPLNDVPQQLHLDLDVADMAVAEAAVLAAGATATGRPEGDGHNFKVFLDPAGHPFCLCE